ncbi:MAG: glycyl-radical enzyme activating protein [Clostridiales Family XIII bacterium]|jgi:pyruvate formate lyase activating enzyme|nr:glycyl-radical enzyme activating protein [Clostridiales Family XIII bacterium]
MDNLTALITNIQGYSIHDGPGIRTVVFFKGCPLRCAWCANPENLATNREVGFIAKLCTGCGRCFTACPHGAIVPGEGVYRIAREKCVSCGACVDACYYGALVRYGEPMSADEIYDKVKKDKMFYDASGGGVTVSGGEPLLYADVVRCIFEDCRKEGIDTCVETCGYVPVESFDRVLPFTNHFYYDLKLMSEKSHKDHTGVANARILDNARYLAGFNVDIIFRLPLISGVNDDEENTRRTSAFIKRLDLPIRRIELMPFHRIGSAKYDALGIPYAYAEMESMTAGEIEKVRDDYIACGIACTVST